MKVARNLFTCVLLMCTAALALAGTPFAQMADVGPISSWPHPTTFAFHDRIDRLISNRMNESRIMRARVRYIRQAFDGSASGGGTTGLSPQTAWKCRNMEDVRGLLQAQLTTDTTILFRRGDTFYSLPKNTDQGIPEFHFGRYTFSSYSDPIAPSFEKPRLLGFYPINPLNLESFGPNVYGFKTPFDSYWVRGRRSGSDPARGYREFPYIKQPDLATVAQLERSWATDSNRNLRIRIGTGNDVDDIGSLEVQVTTSPGISVGEVDDVRIDGLIIEGWGMGVPEGGNGAIRTSITGTNMLVVTNCEWGWTAYHGLLHATGAPGGILLVKDCAFGYHVNRDSATGGGGDGLVSFSVAGQNELVIDGCRSFGGGLSRNTVPGASGDSLGMPVYQHAMAGTNIALHLRRNCVFVPTHERRGHFGDYAAAGDAITDLTGHAIEVPLDPLDIRYYKSFIIGETSRIESGQLGGSWRTVDINCKMVCSVPALTSGIMYFWGGTRNAYAGLTINRDQELLFNPAFQAFYALGQTTINHNHVMLNCRIRATGASAAVPSNFLLCEVDPTRLSTSRLFNTIISNETQASAIRWNYPNVNALTSPGGMAHCAFYNVPSFYYGNTSTPVTLAQPADFPIDNANFVSAQLVSGGADLLPGGWRLEYDAMMNPRPLASTIGPIEGHPWPCRADVNHDAVVDFFDYLDFLNEWASGLPAADFNNDLVIDFFDYLDFIAAFSAGC